VGNKAERAQRAKQIRDAGRMEIMDAKRASRTAPKVVAILALNGDVNLEAFLDQFAAAAGVGETGGGAAAAKAMAAAPNVPYTFNVERHRHCLSLLVVRADVPLAALEVVKAGHDSLLLVYQCTRTHSPHPPPWPETASPYCLLVVHLYTTASAPAALRVSTVQGWPLVLFSAISHLVPGPSSR